LLLERYIGVPGCQTYNFDKLKLYTLMNRKTIFLLLVSILITLSCKKKFVNNPSNNSILKTFVSIDTIRGLEKVGSILKFETVDDYADFIEDTNQVKWAKLLQFTSEKGFQNFFVQHPITNFEDLNAMDENFGQLLNSDGVIIIGNDALKIDLPKKKVYLTALEGLSPNYQSLIIGDTVNKSIHSFSDGCRRFFQCKLYIGPKS